MKPIDQRILELKALDIQIGILGEKKEELRKEIFGIIENEGLTDGYKNENATVSYVERKSVKIADQAALIKSLEDQKLTKYLEKIPAHVELSPKFTKDIKDGNFKFDGVDIETTNSLSIRFN